MRWGHHRLRGRVARATAATAGKRQQAVATGGTGAVGGTGATAATAGKRQQAVATGGTGAVGGTGATAATAGTSAAFQAGPLLSGDVLGPRLGHRPATSAAFQAGPLLSGDVLGPRLGHRPATSAAFQAGPFDQDPSDPKPREGTETFASCLGRQLLTKIRQTQNPERGRKLLPHAWVDSF